MSYMVVTCPDCDETYEFGVVGTTMIGGHECKGRCVCDCGHDHRHCPCECRSGACRYAPCDGCAAAVNRQEPGA